MAHSFLLVAEKKEIFPETGLKDPLQYFKRQDLLVHQTITVLTHRIRVVIQFHHHDHTKEANVGNMISNGFGLKKIFDEIKKCIVLCANCHMELHGHQNY